MAELGSWPSIQRHGLLSTSALLDRFEISGAERFRLESRWRSRSETIRHHAYGSAVIRDQMPMREGELKPLLDGMKPRAWYELINGKIFFWADLRGLKKLLCAVMYKDKAHCVLTVDTRTLLNRHMKDIWLTDQNSGSVISKRRRGLDTFKRVRDFGSPWVEEVAVDYVIPDVADLTLRVEEWKADNKLREIWSRKSEAHA